jgi:DNA repair protein SbcD/Mre11
MRILHTADWHVGDRLGGVDRTMDIRRAVERVANYCTEHHVDVCLVSGDIFSDRHPRELIHDSIEHLAATFEGFLLRGGTVLASTMTMNRFVRPSSR